MQLYKCDNNLGSKTELPCMFHCTQVLLNRVSIKIIVNRGNQSIIYNIFNENEAVKVFMVIRLIEQEEV